MSTEAAREARVRRISAKQDFRLAKTPPRHWERQHYAVGYQLLQNNQVILGCRTHQYDATLDEIEEWVTN